MLTSLMVKFRVWGSGWEFLWGPCMVVLFLNGKMSLLSFSDVILSSQKVLEMR